jgi:hypothetical protein
VETSENGKTAMNEVKTLWELGIRETKDILNMIIKCVIND